ncbi:MAG TPA: DUF1501 domain-containing protein [Fimbriimonadaceae bacterium]
MKNDWWSCDGGGSGKQPAVGHEQETFSRRNLFLTAGLGALSWLSTRESALAQLAVNTQKQTDEVLVVIFLRGGADGLNVVVPYGEDEYYKLRPSLGIASPRDKTASAKDRALDLNGFFGIHPSMASLLPLYQGGELSFVHAIGSFDQTRSHFDAMSAMERGLPQASGSVSSGWLARHLDSSPHKGDSPLRAVAFGDVLPDSLRGAPGAISLETLDDFKLTASNQSQVEQALRAMYGVGKDDVSLAGQQTLKAMQQLNGLNVGSLKSTTKYPASDLGLGLSQVSMLVKSGIGLEVACLDKGGWDTHVAQGNSTGWQAGLMTDLSSGLSAFAADLGPKMKNVSVVVMTEFGRRAYENSGLGTDHGRGSFMILMGGGFKGGQVFGAWPGLKEGQLEGPGDLKVTTDYRNVLAEVMDKKLRNPSVSDVFPGLAYSAPGFCV